MNIYLRLNEVRKAVSYIQKDATVKTSSTGSYPAITHDAVTAAVKKHLVDQGVIISPTLVDSKLVDTGTTTSSGIPIMRYEGTFDVSFINCDEPEDRHVMRLESHALDQGDKAPGKAISYATKYAMLKLFSIETGDQEEERIPAKGNGKALVGGTITPTTDAWAGIEPVRAAVIRNIGSSVIDFFSAGDPEGAFKFWSDQTISNDEKVAAWSLFDSKMRRKLKDLQKAKETENAQVRQ